MSSPPPPHPPTAEALVVNAASMESPQCNFDAVKTTDKDKSGKAMGVNGQLWSHLSSQQLRTGCSHLAIKDAKNAKKAAMVRRDDDYKVVHQQEELQCNAAKDSTGEET